jgi:tetratricopeptide (TPR) repeat protein
MRYRWMWLCLAAGSIVGGTSRGSAQGYRAVRRPSESFLSRHSRTSGDAAVPLIERSDAAPRPAADDEDEEPPVRRANAPATARALRFIAVGDQRFHTQQFATAYQRYKKAAEIAPDLAEAWFRQGIVQIALGRYAAARRAIKRGLSLDRDWPNSAFRLDDLYTDDQLAKGNHFEHLALAIDAQPTRHDLVFLLGLELFLDGQRHRARPFFERALDLGEDAGMVRRFLTAIDEKQAPADEGF